MIRRVGCKPSGTITMHDELSGLTNGKMQLSHAYWMDLSKALSGLLELNPPAKPASQPASQLVSPCPPILLKKTPAAPELGVYDEMSLKTVMVKRTNIWPNTPGGGETLVVSRRGLLWCRCLNWSASINHLWCTVRRGSSVARSTTKKRAKESNG